MIWETTGQQLGNSVKHESCLALSEFLNSGRSLNVQIIHDQKSFWFSFRQRCQCVRLFHGGLVASECRSRWSRSFGSGDFSPVSASLFSVKLLAPPPLPANTAFWIVSWEIYSPALIRMKALRDCIYVTFCCNFGWKLLSFPLMLAPTCSLSLSSTLFSRLLPVVEGIPSSDLFIPPPLLSLQAERQAAACTSGLKRKGACEIRECVLFFSRW